jgi:hypothetical protein
MIHGTYGIMIKSLLLYWFDPMVVEMLMFRFDLRFNDYFVMNTPCVDRITVTPLLVA